MLVQPAYHGYSRKALQAEPTSQKSCCAILDLKKSIETCNKLSDPAASASKRNPHKTMSSNSTPQPEQSILSDRDVNTSLTNSSATSSTVEKDVGTKPQPKMAGQATDMDYHRRVLQSKLDEESYATPIGSEQCEWNYRSGGRLCSSLQMR